MSWNWLNNAWVIGVGTGIVSGLLVTWVARFFLSKKEDREYQQRIASANREVIYAIRPGISEGQIPTREVIVALTNATARRNSVLPSELYDPRELMEELMKEVMDSSFLSAAKKAEYCQQLAHIRDEPEVKAFPTDTQQAMKAEVQTREKERKNTEFVSVFVGALAAVMSGLIALVSFKGISLGTIFDIFEKVALSIVMVGVVVTLLRVTSRTVTAELRQKKPPQKPPEDD